ncbi:hypothetical protein [Mesorhizobium loti]|uniref:hypothetical protein n=1 Tax=Rhizobium loti TaxID=381 RepID=UPI00047E53B3|nr:hypothetical protein [Mesorhizobium loti]
MKKSAELLSVLGDQIDAAKLHVASLDNLTLRNLRANLPTSPAPGTAEMLMLLLVFREAERRELSFEKTAIH